MFNAEGIIELEKQWLKYKIKQRSKLSIIFVFIFFALIFASYQIYLNLYTVENIVKEKIIKTPAIVTSKAPVVKKESNTTKTTIGKIQSKETNNTVKNALSKKENIKIINKIIASKNRDTNITISKQIIIKENSKPYFMKLQPTDQGSELFTSNGFLTLNVPFETKRLLPSGTKEQQVIETIRSINKNTYKKKEPNKILIETKDVDTIKYLKEKYYATSSIVFALMLAEEYYYEKDYKNSLQWALTANDDDSQNTKSWSWFAKAKVKLGQKEDAIRALKSYLSNNNSKRLSTLLRKIELGDTNDK